MRFYVVDRAFIEASYWDQRKKWVYCDRDSAIAPPLSIKSWKNWSEWLTPTFMLDKAKARFHARNKKTRYYCINAVPSGTEKSKRVVEPGSEGRN